MKIEYTMPSNKKCLECNGCCDNVTIYPRRFFHCFYCDIYYDIVDGKFIEIDIEKEMGISKEVLRKQMYPEEKVNERFS